MGAPAVGHRPTEQGEPDQQQPGGFFRPPRLVAEQEPGADAVEHIERERDEDDRGRRGVDARERALEPRERGSVSVGL